MPKGNMNLHKSGKLGENAYELQAGDISNIMKQAITLNTWPKIDLNSDEAVDKRINEYWLFCAENDCRPAVSGLALALGIDRNTLYDWKTERRRASSNRAGIIKKAYSILEFMWETYMQSGKINPASGCFLGKNNFGYHDDTKVIIEASNVEEAQQTPEEIAAQLDDNIPVDVPYKEAD